MRCLACLLLCAALCGTLGAQTLPDSVALSATRLVLLPPANLSGTAAAAQIVTAALRQTLARRVELVDSGAVADVLRAHRIRSTSELSGAEVATLARELQTRYLFVGSIDRYQSQDSSAEVALSARLIDATTGEVVWLSHANAQADRRTRVLMLGKNATPAGLTPHVTARLCRHFRLNPSRQTRHVRAIHAPRHRADIRVCRRVAVVIMGNESATRFAGHIVTNQLLAELQRAGFSAVDPGRVRELMLNAQELTQGEIAAGLLTRCRDELGADFLLTGSVSDYASSRDAGFDAPRAAFEVRLIDTTRGDLIWAKNYARTGEDSAWLFNFGYVHGLTGLSHRMAREAAHDLRHLRARTTNPAPELHP